MPHQDAIKRTGKKWWKEYLTVGQICFTKLNDYIKCRIRVKWSLQRTRIDSGF